jgi:hypothetical protein
MHASAVKRRIKASAQTDARGVDPTCWYNHGCIFWIRAALIWIQQIVTEAPIDFLCEICVICGSQKTV